MRRILLTFWFGLATLALAWYLMMLLHECGHMLHGFLSGGRVAHVSLPLIGFSQTFLATNPHPLFVVWGGLLWGVLFPVLVWLPLQYFRLPLWQVARFLAGFCLIANGAYLGVGAFLRAGDTYDLSLYDTPVGLMAGLGFPAVVGGVALWHGLGPQFALTSGSQPPRTRDVLLTTALLILLVVAESLRF